MVELVAALLPCDEHWRGAVEDEALDRAAVAAFFYFDSPCDAEMPAGDSTFIFESECRHLCRRYILGKDSSARPFPTKTFLPMAAVC